MRKPFLLKLLSVISPVLILAILGIMQGAWFDAEELTERTDAEVYQPTMVQYLLYYATSIILAVLSALLLGFEYKKTSVLIYRIIYAGLLILNTAIILVCALSL